MGKSILCGLGAAALFGASTPLAKLLGLDMSPVLLAGLLYLGSGMGLLISRLIRDQGWQPSIRMFTMSITSMGMSSWDGEQPRSHLHEHVPIHHSHPHCPHIHHRHEH